MAASAARPVIVVASRTGVAQPSDPRARAEALHRSGLEHQRAGRLDEARAAYESVLMIMPEASVTRSNLGNVLRAQGKMIDAIAAHHAALNCDPTYAEGWTNLALTLQEAGEIDGALIASRRAVELAPTNAEIRYSAASMELAAGQPQAAIENFLAVLESNPRHGRALLNLAVALNESGAAAAGMAALETLIAFEPNNADAHFNRALNLLSGGQTAQGLAAYEWRLCIPGLRPPLPDSPRWDGKPRPDDTLLLLAEQGLGDTFQFIRFARRARTRVGRIVLMVQTPLAAIAKNFAGIDDVVALGAPTPAHDMHLPLMSLPFVLGFSDEAELVEHAWITPDATRVRRWHQWLNGQVPESRLRVGIGWRGNPSYRKDASRSLALSHFAALARMPGVALISLQKGPGEDEILALTRDVPVVIPPDLDGDGAFTDTAPLLQAVDLVIASDSALAHLAGALERPTWVLLSHRPDWRWGNEGTASPWYPSATLLRQNEAGEWSDVFARAASALAALTGRPS